MSRFSIITPSYQASAWLKLCIASVADQGVDHEHIIQDSCWDDGTQNWLPQDPRVKAFVEKDRGMYDAINRGIRRSTGEIIAYLNADEQYLPGALKLVRQYFERHPQVDMVFGDVVMVNENGDYLSHRKMQVPLLYHTWTCHLSTLSCGMFFRRRLVEKDEMLFNADWRVSGDGEWMVRMLQRGTRMGTLGEFASVFTVTGQNLGGSASAAEETRRLAQNAPPAVLRLRRLIILHHRLRRWLGACTRRTRFATRFLRRKVLTKESGSKSRTRDSGRG